MKIVEKVISFNLLVRRGKEISRENGIPAAKAETRARELLLSDETIDEVTICYEQELETYRCAQ